MVEKQYKYPHQVSFFLVQIQISSKFDWGQVTEEFQSLTVKFMGAELQTYTDIFLTLFNLEKVPNFPQYSPKCDNSSSSMWFSFSVVFWALNNAAAAEPFWYWFMTIPTMTCGGAVKFSVEQQTNRHWFVAANFCFMSWQEVAADPNCCSSNIFSYKISVINCDNIYFGTRVVDHIPPIRSELKVLKRWTSLTVKVEDQRSEFEVICISLWEFKHPHSQTVDELWGSWWNGRHLKEINIYEPQV